MSLISGLSGLDQGLSGFLKQQAQRILNPETSLGLLQGLGDATGASELLPGSDLNRFLGTLGADPRQAGRDYAAWRGPLIGQDDQMMLPISPWGGGVGRNWGQHPRYRNNWGPPEKPFDRTGPSVSRQEKMRHQAMKDMWRDASKSIDQVPELPPGENWARTSMKELEMRKIGLGKSQIWKRKIDQSYAENATRDQWTEMARGLESLLPDPTILEYISPETKMAIWEDLTAARDRSKLLMKRPDIVGNHITDNVPSVIEHTRDKVLGRLGAELRPNLDNSRDFSNPQKNEALTKAYLGVKRARPGRDLSNSVRFISKKDRGPGGTSR